MAVSAPQIQPSYRGARPAPWKATGLFLAAAALVLALDQLSKWLVTTHLAWGQSVPPEGTFRFTHVHNTGGAFGLFQDQNGALIVTAIIGAFALFMLYRYRGSQSPLLRLVLGMQLGGAIGNLADRMRLGYVVDFFDWGFWPVFNVADASITVSIVLLAAYLGLGVSRGASARPSQTQGPAPPA